MYDVVELLLNERERSYEILLKNFNVQPILTGHCPDCQHEHNKIDFKEEYISPTPISHESKPNTHQEEEQQIDIQEESTNESNNEVESSVDIQQESNEDDDLMFL